MFSHHSTTNTAITGGTKVCTATPWEHRFATALPFRHVQMLCRGWTEWPSVVLPTACCSIPKKKKVLQNTAEISVILLRLKRRTYPKPTCSPQLRLRDLLLMWWRRMKAQNPYVNCWILGQTTSWSLQPSAERIITPSGISQGPAGATRYPEGQKWLASSDLARHGIARLPKHQVTLVGL